MTSTSGSNIILRVEDLRLGFFIKPKGQNTIRDLFINTLKNPVASLIKGTTYNSILNGVTFTINKGDRIALVGENGAGKSTLCRAISGFYSPHSGKIRGKPKIRALFDTAHGLYPELTGQENIQIIAKLLYPEKKTESLRQIVKSAADFSELGQHLKLPVRNYSNGMQTRLTLSILTAEPAELLILDEVFEGADEFFQLKIRERIKNMIANSGASILVSHSEATLRAHCNRSLLLRAGKIVLDDSIENCFKRYRDKQIDLI